MTLIQQFPDISEQLRLKSQIRDRSNRSNNVKQPSVYIEDEAVVQYYEGEFKRWHMKFLFIVAATLGIVCALLLKSAWITSLLKN
jgi:hypothetical protein